MSKANIADYLQKHEFFTGLSAGVIDLLAGASREMHLDKDQVLFVQGDRAEHFYLIREGAIAIEIPAIYGPSLEVQHLGGGKILGWSWLIPPYEWTFQARADEPTELLEFDGNAILARCEADPAVGYAVLKRFSNLMSERLEASRRKMMEEWNPPGFA
ncbi:MAG: cyclic nucleotide-binding domain-containing protein [Ectothiorhodospiraceae bacterium]|jgi:CRP-like cAMP-binding protein